MHLQAHGDVLWSLAAVGPAMLVSTSEDKKVCVWLNQQALRFFGDAWERDILHDPQRRPPWRWSRAGLVALSDSLLWLHSFSAVRAVVPDFFL